MKIPFRMMPSSWGLKGKSRARAEAEYYLTGLELDLRLIEIEEDDPGQKQIKTLQGRHRHGEISAYDLEVQTAEIKLADRPTELEVERVEIDFRHHKIERPAYERALADLREEPWVAMPELSWDPKDPSRSFFELDYNDHFVTFLRTNGYAGATDEIVVEGWLNDVCRSVVMDMSQEDPAFLSAAAPTVNRRVKKGKKGKSEYS